MYVMPVFDNKLVRGLLQYHGALDCIENEIKCGQAEPDLKNPSVKLTKNP